MKRYKNIVAMPANMNDSKIVEDEIQDKFALEDDIED